MSAVSSIVHELPVPQSVQDLRAACGLPAVTVRHGDQVHQFAYTTQPEYVTCVGCLAVREVTGARAALGECWLTGGLSLAQGIARGRMLRQRAQRLERAEVNLAKAVLALSRLPDDATWQRAERATRMLIEATRERDLAVRRLRDAGVDMEKALEVSHG